MITEFCVWASDSELSIEYSICLKFSISDIAEVINATDNTDSTPQSIAAPYATQPYVLNITLFEVASSLAHVQFVILCPV